MRYIIHEYLVYTNNRMVGIDNTNRDLVSMRFAGSSERERVETLNCDQMGRRRETKVRNWKGSSGSSG
jgi:hypothetical protein